MGSYGFRNQHNKIGSVVFFISFSLEFNLEFIKHIAFQCFISPQKISSPSRSSTSSPSGEDRFFPEALVIFSIGIR